MAFEPRSVYEFGDERLPEVVAEERRDHARAGARGERLRHIANDIVSALQVHGLLADAARSARVVTFEVLADHLYGGGAVDIPADLGKP